MRLLVDLGNSRLKWASSESGAWRTGAALHRGVPMQALLDEHWRALPAPHVVVAVTVAAKETAAELERWLRARWNISPHYARARAEQLGVVNRYRDPEKLGADRWVALIGARFEAPGQALCVVGCGTAVTIDALTADGEFAGGVILPGLALMREALANGTAGVRPPEGNETSCLARSTADAVAAGALYGTVGAIERVTREFEQALGISMKLLVTGGDADRVAAHLQGSVRRMPDLLLRGLDRIADTL